MNMKKHLLFVALFSLASWSGCILENQSSSLYVRITSPSDNSTVSESPVEIRGNVSSLITDVWVQENPAKLESGEFSAPAWLEPGKNVVSVKGWSRDGRTVSDSVVIYFHSSGNDADLDTESFEDALDSDGPEIRDGPEYETIEHEPFAGCEGTVRLEPKCSSLQGLTNQDLISKLRDMVSRGYKSLGYDTARSRMYQDIDLVDDKVQGVYTGQWIFTGGGMPDPKKMNCEHTWPQSKGASSEPAHSDLHHLFPTIPSANSARSNHEFGWVTDSDPAWAQGGSKLGFDSTGELVFEVRDPHKGDTARAIFYFSVRYDYHVSFKQESALREWHFLDPPDDYERARNDAIEVYQHNRNPFVDCPSLVCFIDDF
ncbi:MAG: hypothetical protein GXP49_08130 [Deltaproteobacteria bacterium]|nr:hypothetical protein [Deltaproteobacteria bacterium]